MANRAASDSAAVGGCDPGWCRGLTEVDEDVAHGLAVGDEGDDAHRTPTLRAAERDHFVDAGQQQRPGIAGGMAVDCFIGGWGRVTGWRSRRGQRRYRQGGHRRAQGRVGCEHTEVTVAVDARWRHQGGDAVEQLQRGEDQRRTGPGRTWLGALVAKVLAIEFAEPVQGEGWPGAILRLARTRRRSPLATGTS
jgi:hypothetical protein